MGTLLILGNQACTVRAFKPSVHSYQNFNNSSRQLQYSTCYITAMVLEVLHKQGMF